MKKYNLVLYAVLVISLIFSGLTLVSLGSAQKEIEELKNKVKQIDPELAGISWRLTSLEGKNFDFTKIYTKAQKAVVVVMGGTGFLFEKNTQVVTAFHVIKSSPDKTVEVLTNDEVHASIKGEIKATNPEWDIAIIELSEPIDAEPLMPADIISLAKGERVMVISNPDRIRNSLSTGVISGLAIKRSLLSVPLIQIDASLDFGSSGGPVINSDGKVIGLVSNSMINLTFSFAIPIDKVDQLIQEGGEP